MSSRPDVAALHVGQRVRVLFACGASLSSPLKTSRGRLVLDIPGDHFVIREADGRPASDITAVEVLAAS